jgi:hypothetical protein
MRLRHHVSVVPNHEMAQLLASLRIDKASAGALTTFDYYEDDPGWPELAVMLAKGGGVDIVFVEYSDNDIASAEWLSLAPTWHNGYPMPDNSGEYLANTYDLSNHCRECGIGAIQRSPFQIRAEPKWGHRTVFQLNWVFDAYFFRKDMWQLTCEPFGIETWPVLSARRKCAIDTVVQARVPDSPGMECKADSAASLCSVCRRVKYSPQTKGPLHIVGIPRFTHMMFSSIWFGSGGDAHRKVIVSRELCSVLRAQRVRGIAFEPMV